MNTKNKIHSIIFVALTVILVVFDQFTKNTAVSELSSGKTFPIIGDALIFSYVENKGIAWGMFKNKVNIVVIFTVIIAILIVYLIYKLFKYIAFLAKEDISADISGEITVIRFMQYTLVLVLAGAIGNIIDRVSLGYVVDFIYFKLIDFPVFNVADMYVVVGMFFLIVIYLFKISDEDLEHIIKNTKK